MNDIEILTNIISKAYARRSKGYKFLLNEWEATVSLYEGEWYLYDEVGDYFIALGDFEDFSWTRDSVSFVHDDKKYTLQLVKVVNIR